MTTREAVPHDGRRVWFGYTDHELVGPDGNTVISLPYVYEPPHGDSLHRFVFRSVELPGFAWGCGLAWSPCGRYVLFDYSPSRSPFAKQGCDLRSA
jgi:hypothetical protein